MSEGFGLEDICKKHDRLIFDYQGICAPFTNGGIVDYRKLAPFVDFLATAPKCVIPQAVAQHIKANQPANTWGHLLSVMGYRVDRLEHQHKDLRAVIKTAAPGRGIAEYNSLAMLHVLAHARNGMSAAYVSGLLHNVMVFKELRPRLGIREERATAYVFNGRNIYAPVLDAVKLIR